MLAKQFPRNTVKEGSVFVFVPCFYLDEVIDGAAHLPHPAFVARGRVLPGVYISKFQNVIQNGLAYSLPNEDPTTQVDFDTCVKACEDKGKGFHLMTAFEWGALALWCQKNGYLPNGNNDYGKDVREEQVVARVAYQDENVCRVATGTGPASWSHNGKADGIYDLNANVWEWVGGMRLIYGELQILLDALDSQAPSGDAWRAIDGESGQLILPDGFGTTKNSVKLDYVNGKWQYITTSLTSREDSFRFCAFADITAPTLCKAARELLYALGCLACGEVDREVAFFADNGAAERIAFRGGKWGQGRNAGIFKTCFDDPRDCKAAAIGFRSAWYDL